MTRAAANPKQRAPWLLLAALLCTPLALGAGCKDERSSSPSSSSSKRSLRSFSGKALRVSDGDTLHVRGPEGRRRKIRLHGVDTPERRQPFGKEAHTLLRTLVEGKTVRVSPVTRDRYRRLVARVSVSSRDVGEELLAAGLAWHYRRYDKSERYAAAEKRARAKRRGLWAQARPQAPWDYRRAKRKGSSAAKSLSPTGKAPFVGNVRSRVFHQRGCSSYGCRACRAPFASAGDAVAAGYRPHRRCVRGALRHPR